MKCRSAEIRNDVGAIRPLDVAAIVCVVAVLSFLVMFGAGRFKERAMRVNCRGNLLQIAKALQLYSQDNRGLLPDCTPANPLFTGPQWPWDMHTNLVSVLQAKGVTRDALYCPANSEMNDERHWNFWRADPNPVRVIGYPMLFKGIRQVPRNLWRANLIGDGQTPPAQSELSFDATACMDDDYLSIKGTWTDRSNHIRGKRPIGGNVLFLDQHVDWRDFSQMQIRFRTIGPAGFVQWSF
jgi:hypothetical protein